MDATLITAGALALALLVVVLLLIHLNRRAVKYREMQSFPAFESGIQRENFFSPDPPAQTLAPLPSASNRIVNEPEVAEEPQEASPYAEETAAKPDTDRANLSEEAAFEAAFDAPPVVPSDAGPAWGHPIRRSADPAASLVRNLVEGQGSLSGDDLHRMELYRADKLLAAIGALEEEFGGKKHENRRKRLQRLRQHVETLQQGPEEWEEPETMEMPAAPAMTTTPLASPVASPSPSEGRADDESEEASAEPQLAEPESAEPESAEPESAEYEDTEGSRPDVVAESEPMWESWEEESEAVSRPAVLGEDEADWPFATPAQDITAPPPSTELEPDGAHTAEDLDAEPVTEEFAPEPVEESVAEPVDEKAAAADEELPADEAPPAEEAGALAGLSTEELAGLLASVSDKSIRVAAIDRLVEQPSPEGLQALYQCLEDPDPEIQLHALEAAEKLLARPAAE
ncbi:MAG: hypothetical protein RQ748_11495 [Elusimicrobiales bacterium]|nr:hypothetical protein [Elusimicrobiales bacterium]